MLEKDTYKAIVGKGKSSAAIINRSGEMVNINPDEVKSDNKNNKLASVFKNKKNSRKNYRKILTQLASAITFGTLLLIVVYILVKGIPNLSPSLFEMKYTTQNVSMMPAIITTLYIVVLGLLVSVPIGIFTAVFMAEYLDSQNIFVKIIRLATDTLSAIPSIVYGLFGMLFFVYFLNMKNSIMAGFLTVAIMVLPVIIRSSEEAFLNVRKDYRWGSYALGAGRLRTVFRVVLPAALPGILSGVILSTGRIIGESAALIYTLGTSTKLPTSLFQSGRTLSVHMYMLSGEGMYVDQAFATAVVILFMVLLLNGISSFIGNKIAKRSAGSK
ncbi:phosphate ABC transporter permease PstA [Peptostreptococcus russellii]|uniref:Phosphate transport system permease protein PstA n=1 Tax=Peptostreptococcus russellii TaxID=215200 RepID=A0A1H8K0J1_9FIRM|nr:phosphate ABC transporter permease PstA [Peptostreptococcus russellii]SEN86301.1 phosphate ABC transporter membrane protein 2, PhoT family [Peptostreptococcus russellii]